MLSYALKQHLASPDAHLVNFTLLLQGAPAYHVGDGGAAGSRRLASGNETLEQEVNRFVGYFQLPFYHKVLGDRWYSCWMVRQPYRWCDNVGSHCCATLWLQAQRQPYCGWHHSSERGHQGEARR